MDVLEVAPGLWRWTARRDEEEARPREVGCVYYEAADAIVLIDPLVPGGTDRPRFLEALDRDVERLSLPVLVLLTLSRHERSAAELRDRYAARLCGVSTQAPAVGVVGIRLAGLDETVFWLSEHSTLVVGDALVGNGSGGLELSWEERPGATTRSGLRNALTPLFELPVERILVSHGTPVLTGGRDALRGALEISGSETLC